MTESELSTNLEQFLIGLITEATRLADVEWECNTQELIGQIKAIVQKAGFVRLAKDQSYPQMTIEEYYRRRACCDRTADTLIDTLKKEGFKRIDEEDL